MQKSTFLLRSFRLVLILLEAPNFDPLHWRLQQKMIFSSPYQRKTYKQHSFPKKKKLHNFTKLRSFFHKIAPFTYLFRQSIH